VDAQRNSRSLRKAVEGSLKRLRLERIDVYQLHAPDNVVSFDVSVEALAALKREGKIRTVALSNVTQEHIERARRIVPIASIQNRYSFADREWDGARGSIERKTILPQALSARDLLLIIVGGSHPSHYHRTLTRLEQCIAPALCGDRLDITAC